MPIDFYYMPHSPPCRSILMLAEALNIELNLKVLDFQAGEHLKPEFIKINPQHCIPTIVDDGFSVWESRVILTYLASKYGDGSLYPSDLKQRTVINHRLFFDLGVLYQKFMDYTYPQMQGQPADETKFKRLEEAVEFLNTFLDGNQWVAGPNITIADFSLISSVSSLDVAGVDIAKYPNIKAWFQRAKSSLPGFNICEDSAKEFKRFFEDTRKVKANTGSS